MKENCKHKYYIIKSLAVADPYDLIIGESKQELDNQLMINLGRDNVHLVCSSCYFIKRLDD